MSGECDYCGEHTLDCLCSGSMDDYVLERTCGTGCPCRFKEHYTHLNLVRNERYPHSTLPDRKDINVRGREEHEAIVRDADWCRELGLDQVYENRVYLRRWGSYLGQQ